MANENPQPASDPYKVSRGQIEHLNNNLNQRVVWLVIAQSFFFSGYALIINGKPQTPGLEKLFDILVYMFLIASLLTVVFTFIDVLTAFSSLKDIRRNYEYLGDKEEMKIYPLIHGTKRQRIFQHAAPIMLPVMFIIVWIIILCVLFANVTPPVAGPAGK